MISKQIIEDINNSSAIRAMFTEGQQLAQEIGAENVYDFSLGNPCTPVPEAYTRALLEVLDQEESPVLHGYMANTGYPEVCQAVAESLNHRFGTAFGGRNVIMTVGAAGAINIIMKTLFDPGDELMVFAPYFTEYRNYCGNWRGVLTVVQPDFETMLPDFADMERKLSSRTKAVIINNPVNPSGVIYSREVIAQIASLLRKKQQEYGHVRFLVSNKSQTPGNLFSHIFIL